MYLKQMGQVPLLTREQEVEISKRIENAELKAQTALFEAAIVGQYIAGLGAKLLSREERFDRLVIDKKIESRDAYFKSLPKLVEAVQKSEATVAESWTELKARNAGAQKVGAKHRKRWSVLKAFFHKFYFKIKIYEEWSAEKRPFSARSSGCILLSGIKNPEDQEGCDPRPAPDQHLPPAPGGHAPHRARPAPRRSPEMRGPCARGPPAWATERAEANLRPGHLHREKIHQPRPSSTSSRRATWA